MAPARCPNPSFGSKGEAPSTTKALRWTGNQLSKYREEFAHPWWREHRDAAKQAGHGGGDYFVLREFAAAIREERLPLINVYDAATWSSITPLSVESIAKENIPIEVPRFKRPVP